MKVKLTQVYRTRTDKDGNELVNRNGKPYTRVSIKTEQHGDKWLSGFGNKENSSWDKGDEVEIIVEEKGQWLNFKTPPNTVTRQEFEALEKRVAALESNGNGNHHESTPVSEEEPPPPNEEDGIPF